MLANEFVVKPVVLDHQMENTVEQRRIATRFDGQKQITSPGDGRQAGIHHDHLGSMFARLPHIVGGDRRAFGHVRAANPDDLGAQDIAPRIGSAVNTERFFVRGGRAHHAETPIVVDVGRLQTHPREFTHQVGLLNREARAAQHRKRLGSVL